MLKSNTGVMDTQSGEIKWTGEGEVAEKGKFYDIAVPNPRHLLVENLDAAYNYYICKWEAPREKD